MTVKRILLEFARADKADDAYACHFRSQEYLLRTAGGGFRRTKWSWDDDVLSDLKAIAAPKCDPVILQRMGDRLQQFAARADFARHERAIVQAIERGQRVHITLRSAAAELYALPWELLTLRGSGQHVHELPGILIRYAWPETQTVPPGATSSRKPSQSSSGPAPQSLGDLPPEGARILFAWSAAGGAVPAAEHQTAIQQACRHAFHPLDAHEVHDAERDVVAHTSLTALDEALSSALREGRPISVLHLLAHGCANGDTFAIAFNRDGTSADVADDGAKPAIVDPGRLRQILAPYAEHLRLVVLCVCDSGNAGTLGNHLGSFAQTLHRAGIESVIASRTPLSAAGSVQYSRALYHRLLGEPASLEQAFMHARRTLARDADSAGWASLQLYARPQQDSGDHGDDTRPLLIRPYRGLLPFRHQHARFFFGRAAESADIVSHLHALRTADKARFLVVAGASGTGKSSVVMAGAVAQLLGTGNDPDNDSGSDSDIGRHIDDDVDIEHALRTIESLRARTGDDHMQQAIALMRQRIAESNDMANATGNGAWEVGVMRIGHDPMRALKATLATRKDQKRAFLLVVDQFEELFTAVDNAEVRQRFGQMLWSLASGDDNVYCIITVRVDFLGQCGDIVLDDAADGNSVRLDQVAYDEDHRVFVAHMRPEQVRAAIVEPARLVGLEFEPGLVDTIVAEVGAEPGMLPLLQYTLDLLWQRRRGRVLRADAYHALGGVTGALQRKADALIDDFDATEEAQARRLLVRLVDIEDEVALDTRRRAIVDTLRPTAASECAAFERVLDTFVGARLLVRDEDGGAATVEVAHEALIRQWARLRAWLHEDRDKLVELDELRTLIQQCLEFGTVLHGKQLGYAVQVQQKYAHDLDRAMMDMIDRSIRHEGRQRRRARRRVRATLAMSLAVAIAMTGLGSWAVHAAGRANEEQERTKSALQLAERGEARAEAHERQAIESAGRARAAAEEARRALKEAERALAEAERARERERIAREAAEKAAKRERLAKAEAERRARLEALARAEAERAREAEQLALMAEKKARQEAETLAAREKQRADELQRILDGGMMPILPRAAKKSAMRQ